MDILWIRSMYQRWWSGQNGLRASDADVKWKAVYWYAAAHENTVCDVSQIARAKTLHAEEHGRKGVDFTGQTCVLPERDTMPPRLRGGPL